MKPHAPSDPIDEQAALWAARLDGGQLSEQNHAALSAWLNARAEHREAFTRYRTLSTQLDTHTEARLAATIETILHERASARKRRPFIAAALAAAAAIAVLFAVNTGRSLAFATQTAERHVTTLDDGSKIDLNARTELTVRFTRKERRVRLVSGEALFNVAKDATRPFLVETSAGSVRVTGTVFNIRAAHTDRTEVTVLEGTVRVRAHDGAGHEQPLVTGSQAVLTENSVAVRALPEGAAQDVAAWRQGQVVFNDTPLAEAAERFATYHTRKITVDSAAADLRLGGRYSLDDLNGLLESIETVLPIRVSHLPNDTIRLTPATPN